jgi:hypothetical protein
MACEHDHLTRLSSLSEPDIAMGLGVLVVAYGPGEKVGERFAFRLHSSLISEWPILGIEGLSHQPVAILCIGKARGVSNRNFYLLEGLENGSVIVTT